ncbi:MAG: type ISP restriction/modification enzyme, partial [Dolichospermum sp.]
FYKAYNPKAADRLGIVYTPNEIVRFMIESTDFLVHKHFGKLLADKDVEILDPATGTGTFITELIDYLPPHSLQHKYKYEIHCNEVAILPYYIANLNIEYTYKQKMGVYEEFENICFVDTLDNTSFEGKQMDLFAMTLENTARIKRQNDRTISVIIGNPPYNAKQENFNDNNANRYYTAIDKLIKESYIKYSKAQNNIVVYDMYTRFIRWAADRLGKNGIIAFVSNSSFINSIAYDGFRKVVAKEFNEIHIIDMKGNARTSGERRRKEGSNVFSDEIRVGIAVYFLIRNEHAEGFKVYYNEIDDYINADEKKKYFSSQKFRDLGFTHLKPDNNGNWINQSDNDFDSLLPLVDKDVKAGKAEKAVFKLFTTGLKTKKDEWVYDFSHENLTNKIKFFINIYQHTLKDNNFQYKEQIKWDRELINFLNRQINKSFDINQIVSSLYRPFTKNYLYFDQHLNAMMLQWLNIYNKNDCENIYIAYSALGNSKNFHCLGSNTIVDLHFTGDSQCLPLYRYDKEGNRIDNITDWGLKQIQTHYQDETITKIDIFHYTYAVLHNPEYRKKYELNLKREFPRLPYYENFPKWVNWGKQLMEIHINYETVTPYNLTRLDIPLKDTPSTSLRERQKTIKVKLKADKTKDSIILDDVTTLSNIPKIAWEYMLGNRSALEWILDQYKEKKPKDPTIAEKFNTYRFADYKEQVIDLLMRVCTVSVETMKIIKEMSESGSPGFEDFQDFRSPTSQTN